MENRFEKLEAQERLVMAAQAAIHAYGDVIFCPHAWWTPIGVIERAAKALFILRHRPADRRAIKLLKAAVAGIGFRVTPDLRAALAIGADIIRESGLDTADPDLVFWSARYGRELTYQQAREALLTAALSA